MARPAMTQTHPALPPLSLYIHVPWCLKKCPYCDFNSHGIQGAVPEADYINCLLEDLRLDLPYAQDRPLSSIFIGGGTPSLLSGQSYQSLLSEIEKLLPLSPGAEITLEANPGTFEQEKFRQYRQAGINRLSIGIQSFSADFLTALGRAHSAGEALAAPEIATQAGFDNFNLDLMFGLPGQTLEQALEDLETALSFAPSHLSWYQLTIEPNTEFYSRPPPLPEDDEVAAIQDAGQAFLADSGYRQYEISAYSRAGRQSRHNLNYWLFGDYIGIGAGAHGKITLAQEGRILRTRKTRQPTHYLDPARHFSAETKTVSKADLALEFMMNAMRLNAGCKKELFEQRTGLDIRQFSRQLSQLQNQGLLELDAASLKATDLGRKFLNNLLSTFLDLG